MKESDEIDNHSSSEKVDDYIQAAEIAFELAKQSISINSHMTTNPELVNLKDIINYVSKKKKERLEGNSNIEWGFYYVEKY